MTTHHVSPGEVVARIPTSALRDICARDPHLNDLAAAFASSLHVTGGNNKENEATPTLANRPPRMAKAVAVTKAAPKAAASAKSKNAAVSEKLSGREARKRIVAEIERLAVRDLCHHHMPMAHLLTAVARLGIDHAAMGNSATSRAVAAKRLSEHILSLSPSSSSIRSALITFLGNEASVELVDELVAHLIVLDDDNDLDTKATKVEAVVRALEHEAMVAFFESFSEQQLHAICLAMKNEHSHGETSSRTMLASSIIHDQPISQLKKSKNKDKSNKTQSKQNEKAKKPKLSRKKPKLKEGVSYEDVFQWYTLSELHSFAQDNSLKVSGKKKDLIQRILDFLSNGAPEAPKKGMKSSDKKSSSGSGASSASGKAKREEGAKASHVFSERIQALLEGIIPRCKIVNKPLTDAQIDQCEAELKKTKGEGVRLPNALRQLYATCNGFCVQGDWTAGLYIFPLIEEGGSGPLDNQIATTGGDSGLIETWVAKVTKEGHKAEHSVTHPSWLTLAGLSEFDYLFINIDPASEDFGRIRTCTNNCDIERDYCANLETLLEQAATYVKRRERARTKFVDEEPELADDEEALDDAINDEINFGEQSDDDDDDEAEDGDGDDDDEADE